jgi:DNA-binding winged helix-turn-helix (wHTH) protein/tetratricopeptide (TPR) repeat protein
MTTIYELGDYRLDVGALELRGPDGVVPIEPRVLDTLIHLIENRGRLVSKADLVEHVWQGAHVTDSAIARCVMGARRAIRDPADAPKAIHTVHGRGYRFDLPVRVLDSSAVDLPRPRRRAPAILVSVALLAVLAVAAAAWLRSAADARKAGPTPGRVQVEAPPEDRELQLLAGALSDELKLGLDQAPDVERRGGDASTPASTGPGSLLRVRLAPGATEGYAHLEVTLETPDGEGPEGRPLPLVSHEIPYRLPEVDVSRFLAVRSAVAREVVRTLRLAVGGGGRSEAEREASRLFLRANAEWRLTCDGGVAAELLTRSVELDPAFPAAWFLLAIAQSSRVTFCSGGPELLDEADRALERAIELDPSWPAPRPLQALLLIQRGRVEEAYLALRRAAIEYPDQVPIEMRISQALRYAGFVRESRRVFDAALEKRPEFSLLYYDYLPYPYLYERRWDRFLALLSGRDTPVFRYYRGYAESMRGRPEAAREALEPAFVEHPGDLFGRLCQALLANLRGTPEEARVVLKQLARQRAETSAGDGEVSYKLGELLVMAGAVDQGLEQLALAVDQGFFCPRCLTSNANLAPVAEDARFRALLDAASARHRRFAARFGLEPEPAPEGEGRGPGPERADGMAP